MLAPRIAALIATHCPSDRAASLAKRLSDECSVTLPGVRPEWSELIERIQAGVLRTTRWDLRLIEPRLRLAQTDWRDLLMVAGFGESTTAHLPWLEQAMRTGVME